MERIYDISDAEEWFFYVNVEPLSFERGVRTEVGQDLAALLACAILEFFLRLHRKDELLIGLRKDGLCLIAALRDQGIKPRQFAVQFRLPRLEVILADLAARPHPYQPVLFLCERRMFLPVLRTGLLLILYVAREVAPQPFHEKGMELRRHRYLVHDLGERAHEVGVPHRALAARHFLPVRAMVVGVDVDVSVLLPFGLDFRRYHRVAGAASYHPRKIKDVRVRARLALAAEHRLDTVVFLRRYHRLVLGVIPLAAPARVFIFAVVEAARKEAVGGGA